MCPRRRQRWCWWMTTLVSGSSAVLINGSVQALVWSLVLQTCLPVCLPGWLLSVALADCVEPRKHQSLGVSVCADAASVPLCCRSQHRCSSQGGPPGVDQHPEDPGEHLNDTTGSTSIHAMPPPCCTAASILAARSVRTGMHAIRRYAHFASAGLQLEPCPACFKLSRQLPACAEPCRSSTCLSTLHKAPA